MTWIMYDSVNPTALPTNANAVAGYVDGWWPSFSAVASRFAGRAHCLSITVHGNIAACLDVESGAASPSQALAWVRSMQRRGVWRPCVYASASVMPQVQQQLRPLPRASYRLWVASYPGPGSVVPTGMDAHQYTDHGPHGENYDISVCLDSFFPEPPPQRKPVRKPHPKVTAAAAAAALATAVQAILSAHGIHAIHLTTAETSSITAAVAVIAAYLKAS